MYVYDVETYTLRKNRHFTWKRVAGSQIYWDRTGASVDVDDDGDTIVVGHYGAQTCASSADHGAVTVYDRVYEVRPGTTRGSRATLWSDDAVGQTSSLVKRARPRRG